jgi:polynucleotide 5'-hydroxyl-kinase GRC3/NOL9
VAAVQEIHVPHEWEQLKLARLHGLLLVIGATDIGKSTFARYLYHRLCIDSRRVAYLDGDPGQSTLGPPATMTLTLNQPGQVIFPPQGQTWRSFVGAVSPRGHMLPLLVGASRLAVSARAAGADTIIYDTTGLIDPAQGGTALKLAKINLLQPDAVLAIQRGRELESLLVPLRRSRRVRVVDLPPSPARQVRDTPARQAYRAAQFAGYFTQARSRTIDWQRLAVFPAPHFSLNQLIALENAAGFALGLGIVQQHDVKASQVMLYTPLNSLAEVDALNLGDIAVEPGTYRDQLQNAALKVPRPGSAHR